MFLNLFEHKSFKYFDSINLCNDNIEDIWKEREINGFQFTKEESLKF